MSTSILGTRAPAPDKPFEAALSPSSAFTSLVGESAASDRITWRRDGIATGRTGALDLPGTTWHR